VVQPWGTAAAKASLTMPKNAATQRQYSGINILILWESVIQHGFSTQNWLTFRQALRLGGNVRKGEHGTTVVYADRFVPDEERERAERDGDEPNAIPFLKRFTVFNTDQCERAPCRREKGVVSDDLGKPKPSYVHQSHRMPKGLWDQSMTGARPKTAKSSQQWKVRARLVWSRLDCLNPNPCDLSADSRTPMAKVRTPGKACGELRRRMHSVYPARSPVRGLRMSWGPKRVVSPLARNHGMACSRSMATSDAACMATESEYYPNARCNGRDRCGAIRIRTMEEARERESHTGRGKSDSLGSNQSTLG
jgi:hypothetical protein